METLNYLRDKLAALTIETSVIFLRNLGHFESDKLIVIGAGGYRRLCPKDLPVHFNGSVPVNRLKPVYFHGGPQGVKKYKGNYLTYLVDRAMYVMCEEGKAHVDALIEYCKGFAQAKSSVEPSLSHNKLDSLYRVLLGTDDCIEIGLWSIGVDPEGYNLDHVEDDLLDFGIEQCERCGYWVPYEDMVEAFTCRNCARMEIAV
jgi:hypothetical protein